MDFQTDLHIHSRVSDGADTPGEILDAAFRFGLKRISLTDHDSIGAYRNFPGDPFALARSLGIELVPGIELDTNYLGAEVHLLGYGFDLDNPELNAHLDLVQSQRRKRIRLQARALNSFYDEFVVDLNAIFLPERDTVMKPHLFQYLLRADKVSGYPEFKSLLKKHANVKAPVTRPRLSEAIALIRRAGGTAVLAHPGYLEKEAFGMDKAIRHAARHGLAGLETDYPYWQPSKQCDEQFPDPESERAMISRIRSLAEELGLAVTRGSDAHDLAALERFAKRTV